MRANPRGHEQLGMRKVGDAAPHGQVDSPTIPGRVVGGRGDHRLRMWVVLNSVAVVELKDGETWRDPRYFAETFKVPGWSSHLVERMEA